ncbi:unnamed protein product [Closterium sp. NIES-53]
MTPSHVAPRLSPPSLPHCQLATRQLPPLLPPPHPRALIATDHHPYSWSEPPTSSSAHRPFVRASVSFRGARAGSVPSVPPSATGCSTSAGAPWSRSGGRMDSAHQQSVASSPAESISALRSPLLVRRVTQETLCHPFYRVSGWHEHDVCTSETFTDKRVAMRTRIAILKQPQHPQACQVLERHAVQHRNNPCQNQEQQQYGVNSEEQASPKTNFHQGTSSGKFTEITESTDSKKLAVAEVKLVVEEVEIMEFSNDDIAGPINQKPLTVPQDASLDLVHEDLLPPAALSMGTLDFPYDWSTFSAQDLQPEQPQSHASAKGELLTIASLESLQEEAVGSPVSVLRRQGTSPGSATSVCSTKPLAAVQSSNNLLSGDTHDALHLGEAGGLPGRVLLYPDFYQEDGDGEDFSGVMEDDEMWASLGSPEAPHGWLAAACLATCWPKAPRSKRRRVSMEVSCADASAVSASVGAAASDDSKGHDGSEVFTVADSANSDGLHVAASVSMISGSTSFASASASPSASASLFASSIPRALSSDTLSAVTAPQSTASAAAAGATSWVQPRTAFLQALLEDVRRPKRMRGSAAPAASFRFGIMEESHDGATSDSPAAHARGLPRTPKNKRDAATAFGGTTALGVLHLVPGSSSSGSPYASEYAETWNSPSGSGSPGWSDAAAGADGSLGAGAGSGSTAAVFASNVSNGVRRCVHCKSTKTPQWRMGPAGPKTLCNACGVRFKKGKLCPEYRPANSPEYEESKHSNQHRKILAMRNNMTVAAS